MLYFKVNLLGTCIFTFVCFVFFFKLFALGTLPFNVNFIKFIDMHYQSNYPIKIEK